MSSPSRPTPEGALRFLLTVQLEESSSDDAAEREVGSILASYIDTAHHLTGYSLARVAPEGGAPKGSWYVEGPLPWEGGVFWRVTSYDESRDSLGTLETEAEAVAVRDALNRVAALASGPGSR